MRPLDGNLSAAPCRLGRSLPFGDAGGMEKEEPAPGILKIVPQVIE